MLYPLFCVRVSSCGRYPLEGIPFGQSLQTYGTFRDRLGRAVSLLGF
jgi:hypothetical protein